MANVMTKKNCAAKSTIFNLFLVHYQTHLLRSFIKPGEIRTSGVVVEAYDINVSNNADLLM